MRLNGKTALITGAASGLGKEIAQRYAAEGAKVCIADMNIEAGRIVADEIGVAGGVAMAVEMNVTDEEAVNAGVAATVDAFGTVDILVSNAGNQHIAPLTDLEFADWKRLLAIHLDGAFLTTKACMRQMKAAGNGGSILLMGSAHSKVASALKAPYVTAKHGLLGLARVVAIEGAAYGVRSNVICPGFVRTPLVEKQIPEQASTLGITEEQVISDVMLKDTVDGEFTTLEDIGDTAIFLAAFPSNALTGQSVVVSHGWYVE
tara:strand:- start:921 stop:1703 length:783 start_codon:yes stop_codon:yes gene_type:complete